MLIEEAASIFSLKSVGHCVDGKEILKSISVEIMTARVGIVGRNGSGKSTLARLIAGLIAPTSGSIRVNGHNLAKDRKSALCDVGILFQNPDHQIIFPTVEEEISFGLRQLGQSKDEAAQTTQAVLVKFGKTHWRDAYISALSQGQKHLVCLMSVVAMQPRTIILDEPFTGLDIPTKAQLNRYLSRYQGGLLHITHDPDDLANYDQVIWLEQGEIKHVGATVETLARYVAQMKTLGGCDDISDLAS